MNSLDFCMMIETNSLQHLIQVSDFKKLMECDGVSMPADRYQSFADVGCGTVLSLMTYDMGILAGAEDPAFRASLKTLVETMADTSRGAGSTRAQPEEGQKRLLRGPGSMGGLPRGRVRSASGVEVSRYKNRVSAER